MKYPKLDRLIEFAQKPFGGFLAADEALELMREIDLLRNLVKGIAAKGPKPRALRCESA